MFTKSEFMRLSALEENTLPMLEEFHSLVWAKDKFTSDTIDKFKTLEITKIDAYTIDATMLNVTVRFHLLFTYNKHDAVRARVVCLHKYVIFGNEHFDVLGEFSFNKQLVTNLPDTKTDEPRTISGFSDEIVMAYLDSAIKQGPSKLTSL